MFFIFLSYLLEETCNKFHEEMNINERIQGRKRERERNKKESGRVVKIEFLCKRKVTYNTWHFAPSFHIIHPEKLATSPLKRIIHKNSTVWEVEKQGGWVGLDKTIHTHTHTHTYTPLSQDQISSQTKGQPQLDISPFHFTSILEKTRQQIFLCKKNLLKRFKLYTHEISAPDTSPLYY